MTNKDQLTNLLSGEQQAPPIIKRGKGVQLSTERSEEPPHDQAGAKSHDRTSAQSHQPTIKRVNRGYKLREDLIKSCKQVALDTGKPLYEIMEAALEEYLEHHRTNA